MSFRLSYRDEPGNPWFSWQYVRDNSDTILAALREHASLTARAVLIAALVAMPLAVVAYWYPPLAGPILACPGCSTRSRRWPCSRSSPRTWASARSPC